MPPMDWFNAWEFAAYSMASAEIEPAEVAAAGAPPVVWVLGAAIALAAAALWHRRRVVRRSFWCALAGREVEVRLGPGCVHSCSAFEDATAVTCARRCLDRSFRIQWPPALPLVSQPRDTERLAWQAGASARRGE
jgi:hypothetical protein